MNFKKWISVFIAAAVILTAAWVLLNVLVDPFGVFGDIALDYSEYSMTQNPRIAKIAYLDKNHEKYDSYIVGCSKTSSFSTEALNRYFDASFYNMIMYGGDLYDIEKTVEYILENYEAKNIVVGIGLEEAQKFNNDGDEFKENLHAKLDPSQNLLAFYLKYLFLNPEYAKNKLTSYKNRGFILPPSAREPTALRTANPFENPYISCINSRKQPREKGVFYEIIDFVWKTTCIS